MSRLMIEANLGEVNLNDVFNGRTIDQAIKSLQDYKRRNGGGNDVTFDILMSDGTIGAIGRRLETSTEYNKRVNSLKSVKTANHIVVSTQDKQAIRKLYAKYG